MLTRLTSVTRFEPWITTCLDAARHPPATTGAGEGLNGQLPLNSRGAAEDFQLLALVVSGFRLDQSKYAGRNAVIGVNCEKSGMQTAHGELP